MKPRRLVIDALMIASPGGLMLQRELSQALERTKPVGAAVTLIVQEGQPVISEGALDVRSLARPHHGWWGQWRWFGAELPALLRRERADVLFALSGHVSRALTSTCGVVSTVNNLWPFTPDVLRQMPAWGTTRIKLAMLKRAYLSSLTRADAVVLHSRHALDVLARGVPGLAAKTAVVLTGVPASLRLVEGAPAPPHPYQGRAYFLYLSTMQPYKNHVRLIDAYARAARTMGAELPDLVIAGIRADEAYVGRVRARMRDTELGDRLRFFDGLTRQELPAWIHHAHANVFPSLCETNSVVQAEILGMHGVMACSDIPPMNEVAGDAAVLFDPLDAASMASALTRLARDGALRDALRLRSARRLQSLSWDRCGTVIWEQARVAAQKFMTRGGPRRG
jgi:glycosyltransferase involved in cell wall biosynthesis